MVSRRDRQGSGREWRAILEHDILADKSPPPLGEVGKAKRLDDLLGTGGAVAFDLERETKRALLVEIGVDDARSEVKRSLASRAIASVRPGLGGEELSDRQSRGRPPFERDRE